MCDKCMETWVELDADRGESGNTCATCGAWIPGHRETCPDCGHAPLGLSPRGAGWWPGSDAD